MLLHYKSMLLLFINNKDLIYLYISTTTSIFKYFCLYYNKIYIYYISKIL